ncbi:MAG TPA: DEAD/DEAH box helicase, partial [bacterium]|nr:DEAD/DEAH box helicase [bacterium]
MADVLDRFHPVVARWFRDRFSTPTEPQEQGWPAIKDGKDTLIAAPTGSGKTLTAFLSCLDELVRDGIDGKLEDRTRVVYVSPLKALSNDIRKNLEEPLGELAAVAARMWVKFPEIRTAVRTGDTPSSQRQAMLRTPPHILITTPESLYLLLTSDGGREMLGEVRTVIVDEIHAVARDKRGAHLALSLERLDALVAGGVAAAVRGTHKRPNRIGLSATQRPIEEIARFLVGSRHVQADGSPDCVIVNAGHKREMDLAVETPKGELGSVATQEMWKDVHDRVADLIRAHRSTLVFVNTRRMVERVTHALAERLGEDVVAAHHGSLSRQKRFDAENRLKEGQLKAVVATASLELGIDVGHVELVCQLGTPRAFAVGLQRIGRAGHWRGATPKGRLFPVTRDELIECAAFVRGVRRGNLERTQIPEWPRDVLCQQIVAEVSAEEAHEDRLFELFTGAWPYHNLPRAEYDALVAMLSEGISTPRGRRGAWLFRDGVNRRLKGRRGAKMVAIGSGGAIPDTAQYQVVKEPEGTVIGSLDEDFAIESMAGDIFLLGNTSWKIQRIEAGRVRVEDAAGQPPNVPFWNGEAPGRSFELSREVGELRAAVEPFVEDTARVAKFLAEECDVADEGALQGAEYLKASKLTLGRLPTQDVLIAERFFDEAGGMQLIVHAPFGMKINRAFGLALRKRFCASFDFELQAAATDNGVLLSTGPQHSFPLINIFDFLHQDTLQHVLEQAVLAAPMFGVRWRWNAQRSLAVLRMFNGKKTPPPILRMRVDDLLAACFPAQAGCQENVERPIAIPDHPLVQETMRDLMTEAMDLPALRGIVEKMVARKIEMIARDTPAPSPLSHEILNSNPYTFLDDAPLEERRARAVMTRRTLSAEDLAAFGALDPEAIASVVEQAQPDVRDVDELHDVLLTVGAMPPRAEWRELAAQLVEAKRVTTMTAGGKLFWVAAERMALARAAWPDATFSPQLEAPAGAEVALERDEAITKVLQGTIGLLGPTTAAKLAEMLAQPRSKMEIALAALEGWGNVLRGNFTARAPELPEPDGGVGAPAEPGVEPELEWCERELLARIHRRCLTRLRQELQPVSTADFMRFLLRWQHVHPGTQLQGPRGVLEAISQLQGVQLPAAAWEREILPSRVAGYKSEWLDELCLSGQVAWGRLVA